jgi:hypothetical protein
MERDYRNLSLQKKQWGSFNTKLNSIKPFISKLHDTLTYCIIAVVQFAFH